MSAKPSAFAKYESANYPYQFRAVLEVDTLVGGTPKSESQIVGWIKTKLAPRDEQLRDLVAETMVEAGVGVDEAADKVASEIGLCGFKSDELGLFIEGRQVKSMLKEAFSIARAADRIDAKYGTTKKGPVNFAAEHLFVIEDRIPILDEHGRHVTEPSGVLQRFIHKNTRTGPVSAFITEEFVTGAVLHVTIETDYKYSDEEWASVWLTGERNGLGASRSQGFGRFTVTEWEQVK